MSEPFHSFVVFAEMRTGSNFLESNLNALEGVSCLGEAFNPYFIGYPNSTEIEGITQEMREKNPDQLLDKIRDVPSVLAGFRYFHDHDPRILDRLLEDAGCAKIILTRNPLDSYVSMQIARATGQWKLTNINRRKDAQALFDAEEFSEHVSALQAFQVTLLNRLQRSGQTAFYIAYEDLHDLEVMNGLAKWLGVDARLDALDEKLKRQNPAPVETKVENPDDMHKALFGIDRFNLTRTPNFEPRRGPSVPSYVVGTTVPLLYMPISSGVEARIIEWMGALEADGAGALQSKLNQKQLRQWRRDNPGHRSFSVVRHPLVRAHSVFCSRILTKGPSCLRQIRNILRRQFSLNIPEGKPGAGYTLAQHRQAFESFLEFLKMNLAGQTSVRVDGAWASQLQILSGFGEHATPDRVLRDAELMSELPMLARAVGKDAAPTMPASSQDSPFALEEIYDEDLEALCQAIYQRDYLTFGYGNWSKES